ncbi:MAG: hypothetical protein ACUVT7_09050, partial [Thermoplasmata archaeon]
MFGSKYIMPALVVAALVFAAAPAAIALTNSMNSTGSDTDDLVSIEGKVTAFLYDDQDDDQEDDMDDDQNDVEDEQNEADDIDEDAAETSSVREKVPEELKVCAFVIDDKYLVEFGPWWYWMTQSPNVTDVVHVGDTVNVTGELYEDDDGTMIIEAWHIKNVTTGEELTIKEAGWPP